MDTTSSAPGIYDIAISYRGNDVKHARALYNQLRDRLHVFFAEECQEEVVGTDGEETFANIFRDRARIVVVFYRKEWGHSPFTRAEEAAIRQRAFDTDYSFCVWVPTLAGTRPPAYVPPRFIWPDFDKDGVQGLASVVVQRVQEAGVRVRPETPLDEISRLARAREFEEKRAAFIKSKEGADFFIEETGRMESIAREYADEIKEADPRLVINVQLHQGGAWDGGLKAGLFRHRSFLLYRRVYIDSAREAFVQWENQHYNPRADRWEARGAIKFGVDLDPSGTPAWRRSGDFFSTEQVVHEWLAALSLAAARDLASSPY